MNLDTLIYEFNELSKNRKEKAFEKVVSYFKNNPDDLEIFFSKMAELEADDFFGTEGFEV